MLSIISRKIRNRWKKLWFRPIHVFVFHQVSKSFDPSTMWECDWTELERFKQNIVSLQKDYRFISIYNAKGKLQKDKFRFRHYAVLTCDDGWESVLSVLPWLHEQKIPITLFLNPASVLALETRERGMNKLLNENQIAGISQKYDNVTIASHGWNHANCAKQSDDEFQNSVNKSEEYLSRLQSYIPYFAYPCGNHLHQQDTYLLQKGIIPVLCDGAMNYQWDNAIHRECIDGM